MTGTEVIRVLDSGWWPAPGRPAWPTDPFDAGPVRVERDGARLRVEVWPTATPGDLDRVLTRVRPALGTTVQHVVLDLHRVTDRDAVLARAVDRLRVRVLLHGVPVEVRGAPPAWRARWGDGRPVRYRVEEHVS